MKFQNSKYVKQYRRVTLEEIASNGNLRKFYRIIRFSRMLKVALGIALIVLVLRIGV